jgi:hypothetical protein
MKKHILLLALATVTSYANAQWDPSSATSSQPIYRGNNVGIATTSSLFSSSLLPEANLHIKKYEGGHYSLLPDFRLQKTVFQTNPVGTYYYKWDFESGAALNIKMYSGSSYTANSKFSIDRGGFNFTINHSSANNPERFAVACKPGIVSPGTSSSYLSFHGEGSGSGNYTFTNSVTSSENGGAAIEGDKAGNFYIITKGSSASSNADEDEIRLTIDATGKTVIGRYNLTTPGDYKLYVEKGILTEKVKVAVATTSNWADFVFADDYKLKGLAEVEEFIKKNNHLPDVPSAEEVVKEGLDVAGMDAKLLQKIEELTLYVIEQNKKINELEQKLNRN